jgi:hypothetical protein
LEDLIGVLGLGLYYDDFNFIVVVEQTRHQLALGHIENALLYRRYRQLLLDGRQPAVLRQLQVDAQGSVGEVGDGRIHSYSSDEVQPPVGLYLHSYLTRPPAFKAVLQLHPAKPCFYYY